MSGAGKMSLAPLVGIAHVDNLNLAVAGNTRECCHVHLLQFLQLTAPGFPFVEHFAAEYAAYSGEPDLAQIPAAVTSAGPALPTIVNFPCC